MKKMTPFKVEGTMTRREVALYLYGLKCFLASPNAVYTYEEKLRIEAEIAGWENIKEISKRIIGIT